MHGADAFLEAIRTDPDDLSARLVFADWLEEQGDPRGEFIRAQCALSHNHMDDRQRARFAAREQELLALHEEEWTAPFRDIASAWTFRHGFVEDVVIDAKAILDKPVDSLVLLAPIRGVTIKNVGTLIVDVADLPLLGHVERLDLRGNNLGDTGVEVLARHARFTRLRHLDLSMNFIEISGARALAQAPHLGRLTRLIMDQNPLEDMGVYALTSAASMSSLETLSLRHCHVTAGGARYLADSKTLGRLQTLDLAHNELGDSGARALAKSTSLISLTDLRLPFNGVGAGGGKALLDAANLARLRKLDLQGNAVHGRLREQLEGRFELADIMDAALRK